MTKLTLGIVSLALAAAVGCGGSSGDSEPTAASEDEAIAGDELIVEYPAAYACTIYINYPKAGVVANHSWNLTGSKISWRYNVNDTWAVVSDPKRAGVAYPWWGFTKRDCIVGEPSRILEGRSNVAASGWRPVDFSTSPAAITAAHQQIHTNATLRDPANFVIGNVPNGWHVNVTGVTRSNGYWVEVYVPNAERWGYVQASDLR